MTGRLEGKKALITGGSRGIGRAIAGRFAAEGADCLLVARTAADLEAAAQEITAATGRTVETCAVDLRNMAGCETAHHAVEETFDRLDILVNCAGATRAGPFLELGDEVWQDGFDLKFWAAVRLSRMLWERLAAAQGSVVNIVGGFARTPAPEFMIPGAVNAALANFGKSLARLGMRDGVNVNTVHPGQTLTDRLAATIERQAAQAGITPDEFRQQIIDRQGVRRLGTPEDIAGLVTFLCSPEARHIQGTAIAVDGGATAGVF